MDENVREGHNTDLMSNQVDKLIRDVRNTISTLPSDTSGAVVGIEIRSAMPGILEAVLSNIEVTEEIATYIEGLPHMVNTRWLAKEIRRLYGKAGEKRDGSDGFRGAQDSSRSEAA